MSELADTLIEQFAALCGPGGALVADSDVAPYVHEPRGIWTGRSRLVLRPGDTQTVSKVLALANETKTPVVPRGGGTGLVGGQVPDASGAAIMLSLERMNRVREIDASSDTITVEAGATLQAVRDAAASIDRLFPLSLGSQGTCQIGGNLSTNAGGTGVLAYGNTRELCLGLEVVLPTGEVLDDLRKLKKDNTGYDLKNLFIGAEGTLGVITAAVMKLYAMPKGREAAYAAVTSPSDALALFERASRAAGPQLTAFELMPAIGVEFVTRHIPGTRAPFAAPYPWMALVEISSHRSAEDARETLETVLGAAIEEGIALDAVVSESFAQRDAFWALREAMSDAQRPEGYSIKHDISVPVAAIPDFMAQAQRAVLAIEPAARIVAFGHMGDGNLHYNVSQPVGGDSNAFAALKTQITPAVHALVRAFDGSISAEHGIGQMKRAELLDTAPRLAIDLMRRIKRAFDPAGIMNPGKVI